MCGGGKKEAPPPPEPEKAPPEPAPANEPPPPAPEPESAPTQSSTPSEKAPVGAISLQLTSKVAPNKGKNGELIKNNVLPKKLKYFTFSLRNSSQTDWSQFSKSKSSTGCSRPRLDVRGESKEVK